MSANATYPEWQHKPARLTLKEMNDPMPVITGFFQERSLPAHRTIVWDILQAALASSQSDYMDASEAASWVNYCRELELFIEAAKVLVEQINGRKQPIS